jgi:zinc transport system ATP-binding protein
LANYIVLEGITFSVPQGAFVAVMGPNGSGKTTLLRALLGLVPLSEGTILIQGAPPAADGKRIGYVPQMKTLNRKFPGLVVELVISGLRRSWPFRITGPERMAALGALERTGALHLADRPIERLSGGELQRVYLARSIIHRPEIILMDEPTTGIDATGESDLLRLIDSMKDERTILMVTHDIETALHHATHVLILNRSLYGFGDPESCLKGDSLSQAFGHAGHSHPGLGRVRDG